MSYQPSRRRFLRAAAVLAPAVILTPGLLMKVKLRPGGYLLPVEVGMCDSFRFVESAELWGQSVVGRVDVVWSQRMLNHWYREFMGSIR